MPAAAGAREHPLRLAFVGQSVYFRQCALEDVAEGVEPVFLDFRAAAPAEPLLAALGSSIRMSWWCSGRRSSPAGCSAYCEP